MTEETQYSLGWAADVFRLMPEGWQSLVALDMGVEPAALGDLRKGEDWEETFIGKITSRGREEQFIGRVHWAQMIASTILLGDGRDSTEWVEYRGEPREDTEGR